LERIESTYDEDNQTLTFETDKFSTYAIVYDGGTNQWGWLLLFLLIPIGYIGYRYKHVILGFIKKKAKEKQDEATAPKVETIIQEEVILEDIETRTKFHSEEEVKEGNYLEITELLESTNRIVEVKDGKLPKTLEELNKFIVLKDEELEKFNVHMNGTLNYVKRSPGSYAEQGYYVEVDIEGNIVNNYISLKRRLPPTTKKGHKWVKIEKRIIKSK